MATDLSQLFATLETTPLWQWPEEAPDAIRQGLASDDGELRLAAAGLCAEIMDDELAGLLLTMVESDPNEEVAARAAIALGPALELCDLEGFDPFPDDLPLSQSLFRQATRRLEAVYRDAAVPKLVRRRALEAAVRAPQEWQRAAVRAALNADDPDWRVTAVFCLGYLDDFEEEIVAALEAKDPRARFEAVRAAGRMEVEEAGSIVLALAGDEATEHELRLAAIEALTNLFPEGADDLLVELTESGDHEVAEAAEAAIEEREIFTGPLTRRLDDEPLDDDDEEEEPIDDRYEDLYDGEADEDPDDEL